MIDMAWFLSLQKQVKAHISVEMIDQFLLK